jgi:DNA-binding transcriptional regulator YhcF (GntR family)
VLSISNKSDKPIYQQLFEQISSQILKGEMESDFNLPPIRTAAKELRISIITVKKAWEELERAGLIYTIAGKGCFISDLSKNELANKKNEIIRKQITKDFRFYKNLGITEEEIVELIKKYYSLNT